MHVLCSCQLSVQWWLVRQSNVLYDRRRPYKTLLWFFYRLPNLIQRAAAARRMHTRGSAVVWTILPLSIFAHLPLFLEKSKIANVDLDVRHHWFLTTFISKRSSISVSKCSDDWPIFTPNLVRFGSSLWTWKSAPPFENGKKAKSVVVTQPYVTTLPDFIEICRASALYIHLYSRNQQRPQSLYIIVKVHFGSKPTKNIAIAMHCNLKAARRHISQVSK